MMQPILNWHTYFIVNGAIAITYVSARSILGLPWLKQGLSQLQKLHFARTCFLAGITIFLLMPYFSALKRLQDSNFEFNPMLQHASALLSHSQAIVAKQFNHPEHKQLQIQFRYLLIILGLLGSSILLVKYLRTMLKLRKLQRRALCQHKINQIHVSYSQQNTIPFCWSWFKKHFVMLPNQLLEHQEDKRLAIRHELQHIRQGDTYWLHFISCIHLFFYWNPFLILWARYFNELQEFACDEEIILRSATARSTYAQCLINAAHHHINLSTLNNNVLALNGVSKSLLYRRVNMIFVYQNQKRKLAVIAAYAASLLTLSTVAFAINSNANRDPISAAAVNAIIQQYNLRTPFNISARPEVVAAINKIRSSEKSRTQMLAGLERMKQYQTIIQAEISQRNMPADLLAVPLLQSRYQPLDESKNRVQAAGIWQIIPSTAKNLGLSVTKEKDERLNTQLATRAALNYFAVLYNQFHDWELAEISYEIGEKNTQKLINATGSHDAWILAHSSSAPKELQANLALFDATVIIMHKPELLNG